MLRLLTAIRQGKLPPGDLQANGVSYSEDGVYFSIDGTSFRLAMDQHIAVVGLSNSGKDDLAYLVSRLIHPSAGSLMLGEQQLIDMPESLTGRRFAYVGQNTYLFTGSVHDNLLYPLKHRPIDADNANADSVEQREAHQQLALKSGNSIHSVNDHWVDYASIGVADNAQFKDRLHHLLSTVELDEEIYQFGLLSRVDQGQNIDLARGIMQARRQLRDRLGEPEYAKLVEPFDQDKYNTNLTVGENLLFGTIYDEVIDTDRLGESPTIRRVLEETQLINDFLAAGRQIAEVMLDLFSDVEPDSELFERFSFIRVDDLPEFQQLLMHTRDTAHASMSDEYKVRLLSLPFKLIISRHHLGLIDESIQQRILQARKCIREEALQHDLGIEFFDETQYNPRISIQDNILFDKLAYGQANAQAKINKLIVNVVESLALRRDIIEAGLSYEVGVSGARLSATQRQKLGWRVA